LIYDICFGINIIISIARKGDFKTLTDYQIDTIKPKTAVPAERERLKWARKLAQEQNQRTREGAQHSDDFEAGYEAARQRYISLIDQIGK
jgi:hypothetical protein